METSRATDFYKARARLAPWLSPTPLLLSRALSTRLGRKVWLKLENLQPTGSFKVRPAFNGILSHLETARRLGVVASSSGNFAQAVAYAGRELGCRAQIVMPQSTSPFKIERTKGWGAEVVLCPPSFREREATLHRLARETGRLVLHPFDSDETIEGDGTLALELLDQHAGDFTLIAAVSGGGLLAGLATALKAARPACRAIGVQPASNGSLARSLASGRREESPSFKTVADALVSPVLGERPFPFLCRHSDGAVGVGEDEMRTASLFLADEHKLLVEAGGAAPVAAVLFHAAEIPPGEIVCVLSGGNVPLATLSAWRA